MIFCDAVRIIAQPQRTPQHPQVHPWPMRKILGDALNQLLAEAAAALD